MVLKLPLLSNLVLVRQGALCTVGGYAYTFASVRTVGAT